LLALAVLGACAASAHAQVVNGGFETGDFTGWTTMNAPGSQSLYNVDTAGPHHGSYSAFFGAAVPGDAISQAVATVAGSAYYLSFWLDAGALTSAGSFVASVNGSPIYTAPSGATSFAGHTLVFTANAASTLLTFASYNVSDFYTLDDVSVTAVPEPETWALMVGGLAIVALRGRKRADAGQRAAT
jgi:hypothetical protein